MRARHCAYLMLFYEGCNEEPHDHQNQCEFPDDASRRSQHSAPGRTSCRKKTLATQQFANESAKERPDENSDQTKKQSHDGSKNSANRTPTRRSKPLRAERTAHKIQGLRTIIIPVRTTNVGHPIEWSAK